jgi:tetratricopeptide (TPR) repeat protein
MIQSSVHPLSKILWPSRRFPIVWAVWIVLVGLYQGLAADELIGDRMSDPEASQPRLSEKGSVELHRLIKELGSPIYRNRQTAFLKLWEFSDGGRKTEGRRLIESATHSSDIDVAASARWLRVLMQLSTSPVEASRMIEELVLIRSGDIETILRLAENHRWEHLLAMLDALSDQDRARLLSETESLAGPRATLLMLAWSDHQEHRIPALVDHLWPRSESIEARSLWNLLGLREWANQPPRFELDRTTTLHWETIFDAIHDRIDDAVHRAQAQGRDDLALSLWLDKGLWEKLVPEIANRPPSANSLTTGRAAVEAARLALLLQWSGNTELSERWGNAIGPPGPREDDVSGVLLAMCLCGRVDEALKFAQLRVPNEAYECLLRQGRIEEALQCVGITKIDEPHIREWVKGVLEQPLTNQEADTETSTRLAETGSLFARLGRPEFAAIIDSAAVERASSVRGDHPADGSPNFSNVAEVSRERWKTLFEVWTDQKHHRRSFAIGHFKKLLREGMDEELRESLLQILYGSNDSESNFYPLAYPTLLWLQKQRNGSLLQAVDDIELLFAGRPPVAWPGEWSRDGLASLGRDLLLETRESHDSERSLQLVPLALLHKRFDLAKAWLYVNAEPGFQEWMQRLLDSAAYPMPLNNVASERLPASAQHLELLAEILVQQNDFSHAVHVLDHLSHLHPERIEIALRLSHLLRSIGETDRANDVRLQALSIPRSAFDLRLFLTGADRESFYEEAELLLKHSIRNASKSNLNAFWLSVRLSILQHAKLTNAFVGPQLKRDDAEIFLQKIVDDDRRHLLSRLAVFPERTFEMQFSLLAVEMLHRVSAQQAILDEDYERADLAVRACHAANPDQIDTPIELIQSATEVFGTEKTNRWVERYAASLEDHLTRWPDDTLVGNNLAWLYANVEYRLDRALELSRHVAEILPEDSVYLDTLAEVEFRLGNVDKAIEISSKCRQLSPLEKHHRNQLHRFLKEKSKVNE